jgi:hypothetical protein
MNYANQDYMHVNYTLIVVYYMLLVTGSQSKKRLSTLKWLSSFDAEQSNKQMLARSCTLGLLY